MSDISSTLNYLYSLHSRGIKPGLERLELFLDKIGNPHKSFKSFHIAGTNGKGTVANIVYAVLLANGYSVGLYTSPHLLKFNERIVIKGVEIDDPEIASFVTRHRDLIDELQLTFFEITTAMAFDAFRKASVDYAVIEVGLGGRLDATNLVSPLTSVICDISMDHEEWLGKSIKQIAAEKAGIIKSGIPVVAGVSSKEALLVIEQKAKKEKSDLFDLFKIADWKIDRESHANTEFCMNISNKGNLKFLLPLAGLHQVQNCALALLAIHVSGVGTDYRVSFEGIKNLKLCGRLEFVDSKPPFLIDVAHNPKKIAALASHLKKFFLDRKKVVVFGVMKDKNYIEMVSILDEVADMFVFTEPDIERALPVEELLLLANNSVAVKPVNAAVQRAVEIAGDRGLVVVTGSFYTVGEFRKKASS